jgi:catechol 2,3-dioxygenase-like lactoylglutathione lyase family enzyme
MDSYPITGIQQVGVGVSDVYQAWRWYIKNFGFDIPIFDEKAVAKLMLPYTGGQPQSRHAVLAYNLQGGGGLEIWQYTERTPQKADFTVKLGDLGIFAAKLHSQAPDKVFENFANNRIKLNNLSTNPINEEHFFVTDPFGNWFEIITSPHIFRNEKRPTGGIAGVIIGVSNMEKALDFYQNLLL